MTTRRSVLGGRLGLLLRLVLTVGLLALVVRSLDLRGVVAAIAGLAPAWVALAVVLQFVGVAASTLAWRTLLAPSEPPEQRPFAVLFRHYLVSRFFGLVGPGTVVGDATRVYQTRRTTLATPTAAVLAEKALYATALLGVAGLAGLAVETPAATTAVLRYGGLFVAVGTVVALGVLGVAAVVGTRSRGATRDRSPGRRRALARLRPVVTTVGRVVALYSSAPRVLAVAFVATLGTVAATVLSTWALVLALGLDVATLYLFATVPLVAVAVALPLSVQGLGVREGAYVLLFGFVGVTPEAALAVSVTSFALSLVVAAVGGVVYLSGRRAVVST